MIDYKQNIEVTVLMRIRGKTFIDDIDKQNIGITVFR